MTIQLIEEQTTESIIGAFYEVYNILGHGLLERAYTGAPEYELQLRGHVVRREVPVEICYKGKIVARSEPTWWWMTGSSSRSSRPLG
jgi:GxxExxY protein